MRLTGRTAQWMQSVVENCERNTGRSLDAWVALARKAKPGDAKAARAWAREQGLSTVYQTAVVDRLFADETGDDALIDGQFTGPKAALRPAYDKLAKAVRRFGRDVEILARKSQITFSRKTSFAVVRAAAKDRLDVAVKLRGEPATARLQAVRGASGSDPSHVVAVRDAKSVDAELVRWLRAAYDRAG